MGPDPAVAAVRRAVRAALSRLAVRAPIVVALSGGADSTALAAGVAFLAARQQRPAAAIVVDHGLQAGSAVAARRAAAVAYELGLDPVHLIAVEVGSDGGPEGAARTARYRAIDAVADGAPVLLGHTRDDQAETVLLGLGRGSGPRSIAGMPVWDGRHLRPLLGVDRVTTRRACAELGLPVWDDPHNLDSRFTRVRLRREVLPLLDDVLGAGVPAALARTAQLLREDLDALDQMAGAVFTVVVAGAEVDAVALSGHPRAVRTRVLRSWCAGCAVPALTAVHLAGLDALVAAWHGQDAANLPGGFVVRRRSGRLTLDRPDGGPRPPPVVPPDRRT